jgi:DNA-3-methyladenine glycosylase
VGTAKGTAKAFSTPVDRGALEADSLVVAPWLLNKLLVRDGRVGRIVEVEAYRGDEDPASHAYRGQTKRNAVMFGPPGRLYVYFTYGMHWCANVVCGSDGVAGAVLLRAGEVVDGIETAHARRPAAQTSRELARGPARLATCLGLDAATNGADLCADESPVRLDSVRTRRPPRVLRGPRVGISVATERPWRFWLDGDPTVSAFKAGRPTRHTL